MAQNTKINKTKLKILDAAEQLFATTGFAETSMRQITTKADVNLASVNYHFGSKNDLVRAVIDRYLEQFVPALLNQIHQLNESTPNYSINQLFECFKQPLLELNKINPEGSMYFLQLLGRGYIDVQGHLRKFITGKYGNELDLIQLAFSKTNPELSKEDIFWRLHFTLGTSIFSLAASEALTDIAKADYGQNATTEFVIDKLLPYLAAGFTSK